MAVNFPTLSRAMGQASRLKPAQILETFDFGEGVSSTWALAPMHHQFTLVYDNMNRADYQTLINFYYANYPLGKTIKIPHLHLDLSGNTFGYYRFVDIDMDGSYAPNVTIIAMETLLDA